MKILNFISNSWKHIDSLAPNNILCIILGVFPAIAHIILLVSLFIYFVVWTLPELHMCRVLLVIMFVASTPYLIYYLYLRRQYDTN